MNIQAQKLNSKNLSHYEILGPLGRGSNSFVYKAKCIFTNSIVALKVIEITTVDKLERAKKEVYIHKGLNHEGIVGYVDDFKDDSYWYLVLEYCEKGELYSHLKRRNFALTEPEIRLIGLQLLKTLEYLDTRKIIHLDIKLGNIFIKHSMKVKLGDFGFSEMLSDSTKCRNEPKSQEKYYKEVKKVSDAKPQFSIRAKSQSIKCKINKTPLIQGTPNYIAPEILKKCMKSNKADIWSLGCVLYALASGKTPFEGKDIDQTFDNILSNSIQFPSHFSNSFIEVLKSMLESEIKLRKSASDLMNMPFFYADSLDENTLSTIATDIDVKPNRLITRKETPDTKPSYLNQIDKKTIHDIVKKTHITRNKSLNTEPSDKNLFMVKSIKSKRLINEMLAKQSNLALTLQAKFVIEKLDNIVKMPIQRNLY